MANGHGGRRPNSGPAKGAKYAPTLSKEEARELVRKRILQDLEPMVRAQILHSQGINHLMLRQKDGTFKRSDNIEEIEAALNSGDENSYYIFTKDPSVQAFTDLMNRALDKPKEQEQEVAVKGDFVIRWADET